MAVLIKHLVRRQSFWIHRKDTLLAHSPLCNLFMVVRACLCGVPREFLAQSHGVVLRPQVWATQLSPTDNTRLQRCFVNLCQWHLLTPGRSAIRVPLNDPPLSRSKPWSLGLFWGLFWGSQGARLTFEHPPEVL